VFSFHYPRFTSIRLIIENLYPRGSVYFDIKWFLYNTFSIFRCLAGTGRLGQLKMFFWLTVKHNIFFKKKEEGFTLFKK